MKQLQIYMSNTQQYYQCINEFTDWKTQYISTMIICMLSYRVLGCGNNLLLYLAQLINKFNH
jgi:hypothetical protein